MKLVGVSLFVLSFLGLVGCSAADPTPAADENVEASQDAFVGWLVSPPTFSSEHLIGTWKPRDAQSFRGEAKTLEFSSNHEYGKGCVENAPCPKAGSWDITNHPVPTAVVGTYVNMHPTAGGDEYRFVWRHPSGEIRLVDMRSCNFLFFFCSDQWVKTPSLTVSDL